MNPVVEIFSQGEEVVTGQTVDSNAAWLSQRLVEMGFVVKRHNAVGDNLDDLKSLLLEIAGRADCCICTGGLGPTVDDLTAEAVAQAFDRPLRFDSIAYEQIERFFKHRKRTMSETNRKQAMIPEGAERIDNGWGTAPGFAVKHQRCLFAFLPGVPSEMRQMFDGKVSERLKRSFSLLPMKRITIRTFGIGESDLQKIVDTLEWPEAVQLGFRACTDQVEVKLTFPADYPAEHMVELVDRVAGLLEPVVFAVDGLNQTCSSLLDRVDQLMTASANTLSLVETASQGLLAAKCLGRQWLKGAVYEASPENLAGRLGVAYDGGDLYRSGQTLANALWTNGTSDIVLVQLYRGGPEPFRDAEQGIDLVTTLVHNIEMKRTHLSQDSRTLWGSAERKQNQAALAGLDLLRRHLQTEKD